MERKICGGGGTEALAKGERHEGRGREQQPPLCCLPLPDSSKFS